MTKMSWGENSGDEILSGETGRGENISCAEIKTRRKCPAVGKI